jgi:hypothetical protein
LLIQKQLCLKVFHEMGGIDTSDLDIILSIL